MEHLQANGFSIDKRDSSDSELRQAKAKHGVPEALYACHTAVVGGYVIEGHVPADLILRILKEKPSIKGLGVPGMPLGSPGMESPRPEPYQVFSFDDKGQVRMFAQR